MFQMISQYEKTFALPGFGFACGGGIPPCSLKNGGWVPLATKDKKNERLQGAMDGFGPTQLDVPHSLKNTSGDIALSVHLYRDMDGLSEGQQIAAKTKTKFERTPKAPKPAVAPAE